MNLHPSISEVASLADLGALRESYLDGLIESQDALLEVLVQDARYFMIDARGEDVGYFIAQNDTVLELHVTKAFLGFAHVLMPHVRRAFPLRRALVKSFDHVFLSCALDENVRVSSRGMLVRDYVRRELPEIPRIRYTHRLAVAADLPRILAVEQDVFVHRERLRAVIEREQMHLFEKDETLVGFGIARPIITGRPHVEIGFAVDVPFRNKGYAAYILRDLADFCVARGLSPVSGCARDNEASIRTGQRVGFAARYRLLEIEFRDLETGR